MKKKILLSLLCGVMVLGIATGCGKNNEEGTNPSTNNNGEVNKQTGSTDSGKPEENNDVKLIYTFEDPSKPVVFDYPNFKSIEEGYCQVFKNSRMVIIYCRDNDGLVPNSLKDIPNQSKERFNRISNKYMNGDFVDFDIKENKTTTINNHKVEMISGNIVAKYFESNDIHNLRMKGYTFVKENTAFELIGFTNELPGEEGYEENYKEMEKTIDAMIKTLRDDR